ncbi:MAG: bifunctional diaminohydroxyphosphoribosylaminopyrimidine deaminase/5-amino-6-(5-phosphoribosylamino)uracil reductase RibD [Microthrixaceae bacterium]|nr:bifunctional diaminohydroxyphosphoribosylaminopyrimidine deaminase/5-amino-6-(5-phosphoribosylamino)uracil reductase RibD [Microthrixaceae bacterium]MCO5314525.1 bifunctional diaminohydroxyphosphoribosylaminopyrimidine deaminase/5-amino-6-(5-phosphoribosylamino)uracil reductase RibD [Microthrixaceae bacterium]
MSENFTAIDRECMARAIAAASQVRCATAPNPWVGAVVRGADGVIYEGATMEPGKAHAEIVALAAAGTAAQGSTVYVTLEPCSHTGRTPPCVDALIEAGISRAVIALEDPDERVNGRGIEALRAAGITVEVGLYADRVATQLAPYIKHRTTGRPYVVLKMAASVDGFTAAPDGSSQWITGPAARADGHRIRAESDAVIVGAGTVRRDNPSLTVRDYHPPVLPEHGTVDPLRVILANSAVDPEAKVQPCREMRGELVDILDELGNDGILQVLVEGGAQVAGDFHRAGLVDKFVLYLAPALFGGGDARGLFTGLGAYSIDDVWRGRFDTVERVGGDLRLELTPATAAADSQERR